MPCESTPVDRSTVRPRRIRRPRRPALAVVAAVLAGLLTAGCAAAEVAAGDAAARLQCAALGALDANLPRADELDADDIRRLADVATSVEELMRRLPDSEAITPAKEQLAAAAAELRLAVDRLAADPAAARAAAGHALDVLRTAIDGTRIVLGC
jgi:hypothetical protein